MGKNLQKCKKIPIKWQKNIKIGEKTCKNVRKFPYFSIFHQIENIVYNELKLRGFSVDVGVSQKRKSNDCQYFEVDFVANFANRTIYFQITNSLANTKVLERENKPFNLFNSSHTKIILTTDEIIPYQQDNGVIVMNLIDFLLDKNITKTF